MLNHRDCGVVKSSANKGFTILELIIAVALLAILLTVAVPSFLTSLQNNRMAASSNDLLTAMQLARSEALKRKVPISVCAADTSGATPACGSDWSEGWMVVIDSNAVGSASADFSDFDDDVLRIWPALEGGATVSGSDAPDFVRYLPSGMIDLDPDDNPPEFELRIPDCKGDNARDISISRTGRAGSSRVECS